MYSKSFGINGELWDKNIIPDFSNCGITEQIILPTLQYNIKTDFNAIGDGKKDDTIAFLNAIRIIGNKKCIIFIPNGKYIITSKLTFTSGVSLIGESKKETILYFPKSLSEIYGYKEDLSNGNSVYTDRNTFITFSGKYPISSTTYIGKFPSLTKDKTTFTSDLKLNNTTYLLCLTNDISNTLVYTLNKNNPVGKNLLTPFNIILPIKINLNTFTPSLPFSILDEWNPTLYSTNSLTSSFVIQNLSFEFAPSLYNGHHKEHGYNAISFVNCINFSFNDINIINADLGIKLMTSFCGLVDNIKFLTNCNRIADTYTSDINNMINTATGHHGITISTCSGILFNNFIFDTTYIHDITLISFAILNAICNGKGIDLSLDHHCSLPYGNIFSNVDVGKGTSPFLSSGVYSSLGPHTGNSAIFWNIMSLTPFNLPDNIEYIKKYKIFGYYCVFIGVNHTKTETNDKTYYIEHSNTKVYPEDIVLIQKLFNFFK